MSWGPWEWSWEWGWGGAGNEAGSGAGGGAGGGAGSGRLGSRSAAGKPIRAEQSTAGPRLAGWAARHRVFPPLIYLLLVSCMGSLG